MSKITKKILIVIFYPLIIIIAKTYEILEKHNHIDE